MTWVAADKLARYSMPPADVPVVGALRQPDHYLITPEPEDDARWLEGLERALQNGITRIQLRARQTAPAQWQALLQQVMRLRGRTRAQLLLNRDIALAAELGVGVHLGSEQLAGLQERPLPAEQLVAASCHGLDDLRHAQRICCDFAVLGPVQATASHPGATPLGWGGFETLREQVSLPIYALGGMQIEDVREARSHGAQGIAAIRSLWPQ